MNLKANAAEREILRNQAVVLTNQEAMLRAISELVFYSDHPQKLLMSATLAKRRGACQAIVERINQQVNS